jgi:hypothetical protein
MKKALGSGDFARRRRTPLWTMQTLSKHAFGLSQALRDEVARLGEVGATFLVVWLILVLAALVAVAFAWAV